MGNNRYDAHCHIFTLQYAIKEVKNMFCDMWDGTYHFTRPHALDATAMGGADGVGIDWKELASLLRQLYELLHAALTSEKDNLDFMLNEMRQVFPGDSPHIVPLMMDIYYLLAYPLGKGEDVAPALRSGFVTAGPKGSTRAAGSEEGRQAAWNSILNDLETHISSRGPLLNRATGQDPAPHALDVIARERDLSSPHLRSARETTSYSAKLPFRQTDGYCFHMDQLMDLMDAREGELFPFVAIDPRRPGIVETLRSGSFFGGKKRFYGVKLYPRMGYHPLCAPMARVYEYCNQNRLPITFHCSMGGFPPSESWRYTDYGNPTNFEPVVRDYPGLRINFAHLGSSRADTDNQWAAEIIRLVNTYDNVYTDLSCYTNPSDLQLMKKHWDDHPKLQKRLLFGTDFDVMYLTGETTIRSYYDSFNQVFSPHDMARMTNDTAAAFLGR